MRPEILFPYYADVTTLKGVGPKLAPVLAQHVGSHIRDLAFFLPSGVIKRPLVPLNRARIGEVQTVAVTIAGYPPAPAKGPQRIETVDDTTRLTLVYFHRIRGFETQHPVGSKRLISGKLESFNNQLQMPHPDYLVDEARAAEIPACEPVYPATLDLGSRTLRKLVQGALSITPELPEWLDLAMVDKYLWPSFHAALAAAHTPLSELDLDPDAKPRQRLAYDEALAHQLALKARKQFRQNTPSRVIDRHAWADRALTTLPFAMTGAQVRALADIRGDLRSGHRMNRLVQGDVGAGKTLVALMAMIDVAEDGLQSVLMAPTEILARQHFEKSHSILEALGISSTIMTGRDKGKERDRKRAAVASGEAQVVFGTHAVFQEGVDFHSLQLAVIDEQHRFGVGQRQKLFSKGEAVHYLSMSATPIPRTLALTQYGEADLSILDEKPAGRQPIHTAVVPRARLADVMHRLKGALADGQQAYWVCPLVEDTAESDLIAAEKRHEELQEALGIEVGLVHGRMPSETKDNVVTRFAAGELRVLCATTVVEVGIDVPTASIIIIEQAERFGLAQLHQLRGRVGRGAAKSACILLYDSPLSKNAKARLELLRDTEDGFKIAEMDWKLRGEGDILGAKQSGFPDYRFVDPVRHTALIALAAREAVYILHQGDALPAPRRKAIEVLKQLFDWRADVADKQD
ncbi:DEAD/DEAH box helicase family protein [Asticcacaulis biprosthecium C19]|uniref:DEAD/DEAH box helicase family protein n=1 Tax=Asticcacaulis biprosthecium C19 TaxID=715226 RepID=F4QQU6_9CAUL|nr:ATP-dependent DNA helicase RecG [Asticcacaulis biprosthecium]EGF90583.1 DEAD/DEAH box helicase family protein [Asticcacaulis biprosthecium C19]